jgi:hypothetical protein
MTLDVSTTFETNHAGHWFEWKQGSVRINVYRENEEGGRGEYVDRIITFDFQADKPRIRTKGDFIASVRNWARIEAKVNG